LICAEFFLFFFVLSDSVTLEKIWNEILSTEMKIFSVYKRKKSRYFSPE